MANYLEFEARKISYRQTKDGVVVSFLINPHDVPDELATAELQTIYIARLQQNESGSWIEEQASVGSCKPTETAAPQSGEEQRQPSQKGGEANTPAKCGANSPPHAEQSATHGANKPHRDWSSLPLSEQAGIRCNDPRFIEFMRATRPGYWSLGKSNVLGALYLTCEIKSRKEFDTDPKKAANWRVLNEEYETSVTTRLHAETYR